MQARRSSASARTVEVAHRRVAAGEGVEIDGLERGDALGERVAARGPVLALVPLREPVRQGSRRPAAVAGALDLGRELLRLARVALLELGDRVGERTDEVVGRALGRSGRPVEARARR